MIKYINDGDVMYSMVTMVNNTVFYIWKFLRVDFHWKFLRVNFQSPHQKKEKVSNHVWWQVLSRWSCWLLHNVYKYQIISCTSERDTIVLIAVSYTFVKNVSDISWWHGSVIPMKASRKAKLLVSEGVGGWAWVGDCFCDCKAEAQRPRSRAEVGREPGEHGDLELPWR